MPKETRAWAVVCPRGNLRVGSIRHTEPDAKSGYADDGFPWEQWEATGYRVIEVRIVPVEEEE